MDTFVRQLAKLAGLPETLAAEVVAAAREALAAELSPEQLARVDALLADKRKSALAGRMIARLARDARDELVDEAPPDPESP